MVVRAGMSASAIGRLQQEVAGALRQPDVAERAASLRLDLVGSTPEEFAASQGTEIVKWSNVSRIAGIAPG
jgi:tripartite-type tricarboxylate transporter receptor subunit TctC